MHNDKQIDALVFLHVAPFEMINKIIASGVGDRNMVRSKDGGYEWRKE